MSDAASPWPVTVRLDEISRLRPDEPLHRRLVANEIARTAIAEVLDLESLNRLEADLVLRRWFDGVSIEGRWRADIVQICGVSLEPFPTPLKGQFQVRAVPEGSALAPDPEDEVTVDPDADDPPDVLDSDVVDVGAYVVEHLALEIDPFPRKPGVAFEPPAPSPEASPFAALKDFKPRGGRE
ncbi:MAG TPA: YceD family protein [Caulobacteraceae bacterium]|jgi:uncharacterized metal-binding protein YceD (DUF177 family)|nr:YceD family protein [Caulobacteraceae bacterium]